MHSHYNYYAEVRTITGTTVAATDLWPTEADAKRAAERIIARALDPAAAPYTVEVSRCIYDPRYTADIDAARA